MSDTIDHIKTLESFLRVITGAVPFETVTGTIISRIMTAKALEWALPLLRMIQDQSDAPTQGWISSSQADIQSAFGHRETFRNMLLDTATPAQRDAVRWAAEMVIMDMARFRKSPCPAETSPAESPSHNRMARLLILVESRQRTEQTESGRSDMTPAYRERAAERAAYLSGIVAMINLLS